MKKVAVVVSHPIQHFCPQYSSWAKLTDVELHVIFASNHGLVPYLDRDFKRTIKWEDLNLDFPYEFLAGAEGETVNGKIDSIELEAQLEAFAPSLLIIYGYAQKLQRRALKWAKKDKVPVAMISDAELRTKRNPAKAAIKSLILPRYLHQVDYFLTVGDANEAYYRYYGVKDYQFVRTFFPIDRNHYENVVVKQSAARKSIRTALGIPDHHKVILKVGKLVPWKRQQDLVKFSNKMQGQREDITIIIAGTGPDEKELHKLCKHEGPGGVIFAGFIIPHILAEYYCAADIYTHCSEHEPHTLAISEAIYCGLPIVISDRCGSYGPTDDVQHGFNGLVYKYANIEDLSKRLLYIIDNKDQREEMGKASSAISRHHQNLAHGLALKQVISMIKADALR